MKDKKFVCTTNPYAGFMMSFDNGLTVSVQWGAGNYCDNRRNIVEKNNMGYVHSNTAELAIWESDDVDTFVDANKFAPEGVTCHDDVLGFLTPEQVVTVLNNIKNYKAEKEDVKPAIYKDFDSYGYGYYIEITKNYIKLGESWPREGGIYWEGTYEEFMETQKERFKRNSIALYSVIIKKFSN